MCVLLCVLSVALVVAGVVGPARATSLQKLRLDEIIQKSIAIAPAKVSSSAGALCGQDIYTYYKLQILEDLRSAGIRQIEVSVPGGSAGGLRQIFSGAPVLNAGDEYVFFLWTSPSGLTQVIGLSQGLFSVKESEQGDLVVARRPTSELMLDSYGHAVDDQSVSMRLSELRGRVQSVLRAGKLSLW
jgi:hypothetical protein